MSKCLKDITRRFQQGREVRDHKQKKGAHIQKTRTLKHERQSTLVRNNRRTAAYRPKGHQQIYGNEKSQHTTKKKKDPLAVYHKKPHTKASSAAYGSMAWFTARIITKWEYLSCQHKSTIRLAWDPRFADQHQAAIRLIFKKFPSVQQKSVLRNHSCARRFPAPRARKPFHRSHKAQHFFNSYFQGTQCSLDGRQIEQHTRYRHLGFCLMDCHRDTCGLHSPFCCVRSGFWR